MPDNTPNIVRPKFDREHHIDATPFLGDDIPGAQETPFHFERNGIKLPMLKGYIAKRGQSDKAGKVYPAVAIDDTLEACTNAMKFVGADIAAGILERAINQRSQTLCHGEKSNVILKSADGINYIDVTDYLQAFNSWTARGEGEARITKAKLSEIKSEAAKAVEAFNAGQLDQAGMLALLQKLAGK